MQVKTYTKLEIIQSLQRDLVNSKDKFKILLLVNVALRKIK